MKELKFLQCETCKKVLLTVIDTAVPTMCCGKPMKVLEPGTTEAAVEKHLPVATLTGTVLKVEVGEVEHPRTEEHHIAFITVVYEDGSYAMKELAPTEKPEATFISGLKPVSVYAFCNLHGLWKTRL